MNPEPCEKDSPMTDRLHLSCPEWRVNRSNSTPRLRILAAVAVIVLAVAAQAQAGDCQATPSWNRLFTGTLGDFRRLSSNESLGILALGGAAAIGSHSVDRDVTRSLSRPESLHDTFKAGAIIGGTPLELGSAFATYAIGRALNKGCMGSLGADLVQAQLVAEGLTIGLKQATRRSRPDGSGFSFPSGHTASTFASAAVLQRHFGWKVGLPAYAAASYVALSRVQMERHFLSDVAFGAAVGIVAGRSVSIGHGRRLALTPIASPNGGAGAGFTLIRSGTP